LDGSSSPKMHDADVGVARRATSETGYAPRHPMAEVETLRDGRFVLLESLGEGAQGQTFAGVDKREGRPVAIKRFDVRGARTWKEAELAEREAMVLQSLSHPKLPRYIDHFEHEGALYLVMEKIEGESLASLRRRGVVFGETDVVRLLSDASDVLDYLHSRVPPVIHRDLKPGNVLRRPDGSFAFVDFGSVRDKLRPEGGSTVVGTFGYMAPEQFQGRAFPASDTYGIGATALCMLTGQEPEALPHKGLALDVRGALQGSARGRLASVLERMLDPDPDRRAARIAPLLVALTGSAPEPGCNRWMTPREGELAGSGDVSASFERQAQEFERRAEDFERRAASGGAGSRGWRRGAARYRVAAEKMRDEAGRREAASARKQARRAMRRAHAVMRAERRFGGGGPPRPVRILVALVFTIGMLALLIATQVVVPFVLQLLAIFFARRPLLTAAATVREAGQTAAQQIDRSRRWFAGGGRDEERDDELENRPSGSAQGADRGTEGVSVRASDGGRGVGARVAIPIDDEGEEGKPEVGEKRRRS
jgi:hypothetical protein